MKNKYLILMFQVMLFFHFNVFAQEKKEELVAKDFPGWKIDSFISGSLHNKKSHDLAMILVKENENVQSNDMNDASLVIYLENKNHKLELHTKSAKAICVNCAGAKGPPGPLGRLSLGHDVLLVTYSGGSREVWTHVLKWRLSMPQNKFLLIGESYKSIDTLNPQANSFLDINYLALKAEKKVARKQKTVCRVNQDYKSIEMDSYEYDFGERPAKIGEACQ